MNRSGAVLGALAIAILFGDGAFALLLTWNATPHPETMAVAGTFPDYHGGRIGSFRDRAAGPRRARGHRGSKYDGWIAKSAMPSRRKSTNPAPTRAGEN